MKKPVRNGTESVMPDLKNVVFRLTLNVVSGISREGARAVTGSPSAPGPAPQSQAGLAPSQPGNQTCPVPSWEQLGLGGLGYSPWRPGATHFARDLTHRASAQRR